MKEGEQYAGSGAGQSCRHGTHPHDVILHSSTHLLDIIWCCVWSPGLRYWATDVVGHHHPDGFCLLWSGATRKVRRRCCPRPEGRPRKAKPPRGTPCPHQHATQPATDRMDGRHSRYPTGSGRAFWEGWAGVEVCVLLVLSLRLGRWWWLAFFVGTFWCREPAGRAKAPLESMYCTTAHESSEHTLCRFDHNLIWDQQKISTR